MIKMAKSTKAKSDQDKKETKPKKLRTYVLEQEYKGNKTLAIFEGKEEDHVEGKFPIIAFGDKKAKAILKEIEAIQSWVDSL